MADKRLLYGVPSGIGFAEHPDFPFSNNFAAEPWIDLESNREKDAILALRDDRPGGLVPGDGLIAALVAGIDTQDFGFYYSTRAVSYWRTSMSTITRTSCHRC